MCKVYAVRSGKQTGIFNTWEECQSATKGYSGAEYKSFKSMADAEQYMRGDAPLSVSLPSVGVLLTFTSKLKGDVLKFTVTLQSKLMTDVVSVETDVSGYPLSLVSDILPVVTGLYRAKSLGISEVTVVHRNEGIEAWYTGAWSANTDFTRQYAAVVRSLGLVLKFERSSFKSGAIMMPINHRTVVDILKGNVV